MIILFAREKKIKYSQTQHRTQCLTIFNWNGDNNKNHIQQ